MAHDGVLTRGGYGYMVLKVGLGLVVVVALGLVLAVALGSLHWTRVSRGVDEALVAGIQRGERLPRDVLPEVVARYADRAIPADAPEVAAVRLRQSGTFQLGEGADGWQPFTATEVMRLVEPGFFWDASIEMAPLMRVRVRDSYVDGRAGMLGKILSLIPVVDAADEEALRRGALSRYLAESAWIPPRLVSGPGLTWAGIDERTAQATLVDRGTAVTLGFTFSSEGDPIEVYGTRAREADGRYIETPWIGRFREHAELGGFRIPLYGEVAWVIDGEEQPYWRGTITSAEFITGAHAGS